MIKLTSRWLCPTCWRWSSPSPHCRGCCPAPEYKLKLVTLFCWAMLQRSFPYSFLIFRQFERQTRIKHIIFTLLRARYQWNAIPSALKRSPSAFQRRLPSCSRQRRWWWGQHAWIPKLTLGFSLQQSSETRTERWIYCQCPTLQTMPLLLGSHKFSNLVFKLVIYVIVRGLKNALLWIQDSSSWIRITCFLCKICSKTHITII